MAACQETVVILSTTLLTDRVLLYTDLLSGLSANASPVVWSTGLVDAIERTEPDGSGARFERFPHTTPLRFRYQLLRRVSDYAWDTRKLSRSRESFWTHRRRASLPLYHNVLRVAARAIAGMRAESSFERLVERTLFRVVRSAEAVDRLENLRPALLVTTSPFREQEPGIIAAARRQKVPVIAFITSWDNISTKNRLGFRYDGYLVWSKDMREELHRVYPMAAEAPTHVVGAPQFDVFRQVRFQQTREEFCATEGLRANRPVIVYGLGSPNLVREEFGALAFANRVLAGEFGDTQLLIRPHPVFRAASALEQLAGMDSRIVVQACARDAGQTNYRVQSAQQIRQWVNTFRHADVVINLASTITVDAALCDRPIVNLDYDPEPGRPQQLLVRDINHTWDHFKPIAESGGVWLAETEAELADAVRTYLRNPELHRAGRQAIVERVCGYADGRCGKRFAEAVLSFLSARTRNASSGQVAGQREQSEVSPTPPRRREDYLAPRGRESPQVTSRAEYPSAHSS